MIFDYIEGVQGLTRGGDPGETTFWEGGEEGAPRRAGLEEGDVEL